MYMRPKERLGDEDGKFSDFLSWISKWILVALVIGIICLGIQHLYRGVSKDGMLDVGNAMCKISEVNMCLAHNSK